MKTIGVLALQGAFREHCQMIKALGHNAIEVRSAEELAELDGIILPGGESTAIGKLLHEFQLFKPLQLAIQDGLPVWGTCAGMILLANRIVGESTQHLSVMSVSVQRNAYGRQLSSFVVNETIPTIAEHPIPLVFIRAPYIVEASETVSVLHRLNGHIIAARENNCLVTSFHPELTNDDSFHKFFIEEMVS